MGVRETYFDESLPVFYFPVGRRELIRVTRIAVSEVADWREVRFTYREAPDELGTELLAAGCRSLNLRAGTLEGRSLLVPSGRGWTVPLLDL